MSYNPIYLMAYEIQPEWKAKVYYLGFPAEWKCRLFEIARIANADKKKKAELKEEYGLPTNSLKKLVNSWMKGIASLAPLTRNSSDELWLCACEAFSEERLKLLCGIVKAWVTATYVVKPKISALAKQKAKKLRDEMSYVDLKGLQQSKEISLTSLGGAVTKEGYSILPLVAVNKLCGQTIYLNGRELVLCYVGQNEMITRPIQDEKSKHSYSFVFRFSVQTTPPERKALLLCDISIRRWIYARLPKKEAVYLKNDVYVHIRVGENKYCKIPITYHSKAKAVIWSAQDKECYDLYGYHALPEIAELWSEMESGTGEYLIPYKNGMPSVIPSKIGTGVPVKDKVCLFAEVLERLQGFVKATALVEGVGAKNIQHFEDPLEYQSREEFREWVGMCTETNHITFELFGLMQDEKQYQLMKKLEKKLLEDFGENREDSCLAVDMKLCDAGELQAELVDSKENTKLQRVEEIKHILGSTTKVVASLFVLPDADCFEAERDPKQVLRNGFACSGRVVQFITPSDEISDEKIKHTVYDVYRQLGIVTFLDIKKAKSHPMINVDCVGIHICTQVEGISNKGRFLPLIVETNLQTGKTTVQCEAFQEFKVNYREACLEMAKIFWNKKLEDCCVSGSRSPAKQVLLGLRNKYQDSNKAAVVVMVNANGNSRPLWSGISDKGIGEYALLEDYIPQKIDAGMKNNPYPISLTNTGIRIIRVRNNAEIPDYYTEERESSAVDNPLYCSASGLFQYGKVFYGIAAKPNDKRFNRSYVESKIDHPTKDYAEKVIQEFYPIQLQKGDNAVDWVRFVNATRQLPIQYSQATSLPLPLHLAKGVEEYLFKIK